MIIWANTNDESNSVKTKNKLKVKWVSKLCQNFVCNICRYLRKLSQVQQRVTQREHDPVHIGPMLRVILNQVLFSDGKHQLTKQWKIFLFHCKMHQHNISSWDVLSILSLCVYTIEIVLTQRENVLFGHFGRKSGSCNKLGCFTRWLEFFLYLKSSKLPLNLLCYTAVPVFFQKRPKSAQPNFLSLGVTTISMVYTESLILKRDTRLGTYIKNPNVRRNGWKPPSKFEKLYCNDWKQNNQEPSDVIAVE